MRFAPATSSLMVLLLSLMPATAWAQNLTAEGSPLPDQPYTLIFPDVMTTSGEPGGPLTINHPTLPLQCILTVVPVDDTSWTPESALAALDPVTVAAGWNETFPGFTLGASRITNYQSNPALQYEGSTPASEPGAITLVHTETVDGGNGYTLDCFYGTELAGDVRPLVDAIVANFSTRQDAQPVVTP
jgi:hypothetical protein